MALFKGAAAAVAAVAAAAVAAVVVFVLASLNADSKSFIKSIVQ